MSAVPYKSIRSQLQTGDLLLSSGGNILSAITRMTTGSRWAHIAMLVRLDDRLICWEATRAGVVDVDLDEVLSAPRQDIGRVAIRKLLVDRTRDMLAALEELRWRTKKAVYLPTCLHLIPILLNHWAGRTMFAPPGLFCSKLVAIAYQEMGLLDANYDPHIFVPAVFSSAGPLRLIANAALSHEIIVKPCLP